MGSEFLQTYLDFLLRAENTVNGMLNPLFHCWLILCAANSGSKSRQKRLLPIHRVSPQIEAPICLCLRSANFVGFDMVCPADRDVLAGA